MNDSTEPRQSRLGTAQLLAHIPTQLGYHPGEQHLLGVGLQGRRPGPILAAAYDPEIAEYAEFNDYLAETMATASRRHRMTSWIIVAYGPQAEQRGEMLTQELERSGVNVEAIHTVRDGRFQTLTEDGWSAPTRLGVDEVGLSHGSDALASIEQVQTAMQPDPIASIAPLSASERVQFDPLPPTGCVVKARALVDELADSGSEPDPHAQARLAHLIGASRVVRDNVIAYAIDPRNAPALAEQRADVLLQLYKGAEPAIRPPLATAAAAAQFYLGRGEIAVSPILEHTLKSEELARDITAMLEQGANGVAERGTFVTEAQVALRSADAFWTQQRNDPHSAFPAGMLPSPLAPTGAGPSLG